MRNTHGSFIWYELLTPDPDAAAAFYGAVVGWTTHAHGAGGEYRLWRTGAGVDVGGLMAPPGEGAPAVARRGGAETVRRGRIELMAG